MRPPLPDDVERSAYAEEFVSNCLQMYVLLYNYHWSRYQVTYYECRSQ